MDLRGRVPDRCLGDSEEIAARVKVSDASANVDGSLWELGGSDRQAHWTGV
jgi:hypothetical protein